MTKTTPMTLEQQRSTFAWKSVQGCSEAYVKLAKGAPALIMNNGLMQTLAFYNEKGHHELAKHLREWLAFRIPELNDGKDFAVMMTKLLAAESSIYRQASEETLLLLRWIRQFAAALKV